MNGTSKEKQTSDLMRMCSTPASSAHAKGTRVERDQRQSVPTQEEGARGDREALRASRWSYQDELDLQGESLATYQHLLQGFGEGGRRPHQDHLHEDLLWECLRWSDTFANQLLRVHFRGCRCAWDKRYILNNKRRDFFETVWRLRFGGHVQIAIAEHTTLEDLAAICLKRFKVRGGGTLVPSSVKLAKWHYEEVLLDKFLATRADTVAMTADCGEEHPAHPTASPAKCNDSDVDWWFGRVQFCRRSAGSTRRSRKLRLACSRALE